MSTNHVSSHRLAHLGSRAMREPWTLSLDEIRELGASVVSQAPSRPPSLFDLLSTEHQDYFSGEPTREPRNAVIDWLDSNRRSDPSLPSLSDLLSRR